MKEQILKEFDEIYGQNHHKICIGKNCECHKVVKQFLIKAISKTREETIREERERIYCYVEEMLIGGDNELLKNLSNIIFDKIN